MPDPGHPDYPFDAGHSDDGLALLERDVASRCHRIDGLTLAQCIAARDNPRLFLQASVQRRLNARIRRLFPAPRAADNSP